MEYNIYCDESCHLENDGINVMVLGAIWCPKHLIKHFNKDIKNIKNKYGVKDLSEIKWTKISSQKKEMYEEIIDYFFQNHNLHFRCLIVPDKSKLDHHSFNQTHDDWYYKMYFDMLKTIFNPQENYNVYIDIKDTNSHQKSLKLLHFCRKDKSDFSKEVIKKIHPIRSDEVQLMQIVDILTGAVCYANRIFPIDFVKSTTKQNLIGRIKFLSGYTLSKTTLYREDKFNIFVWNPSER